MSPLTPTQHRLLYALSKTGGEATGLFRLAMDAELEWANAYRRLRGLEALGIVTIRRMQNQVGRPLLVRVKRQRLQKRLAVRQLALDGGLGLDIQEVVVNTLDDRKGA